MPAHLLDDGTHAANNGGANLFIDYATVADSTGVYTTSDYANIVEHLVGGVAVCECVCVCPDLPARAQGISLCTWQ